MLKRWSVISVLRIPHQQRQEGWGEARVIVGRSARRRVGVESVDVGTAARISYENILKVESAEFGSWWRWVETRRDISFHRFCGTRRVNDVTGWDQEGVRRKHKLELFEKPSWQICRRGIHYWHLQFLRKECWWAIFGVIESQRRIRALKVWA